jgi:hypothetical protein
MQCPLSLEVILVTLDGRYLAPLATFLTAVSGGKDAVREWIAKNDVGQMPRLGQ